MQQTTFKDWIGCLVSSLLSSAAESRLIEKEHKFLKLHGKDNPTTLSKKQESEEKEKKYPDTEFQLAPYMLPFMHQPYLAFPPRFPPFPPRPAGPMRRGLGRGRARFPSPFDCCFKCREPSHFQNSCPRK